MTCQSDTSQAVSTNLKIGDGAVPNSLRLRPQFPASYGVSTAINTDSLPGDVTGPFTGEKEDNIGYFFRLSDAARRVLAWFGRGGCDFHKLVATVFLSGRNHRLPDAISKMAISDMLAYIARCTVLASNRSRLGVSSGNAVGRVLCI